MPQNIHKSVRVFELICELWVWNQGTCQTNTIAPWPELNIVKITIHFSNGKHMCFYWCMTPPPNLYHLILQSSPKNKDLIYENTHTLKLWEKHLNNRQVYWVHKHLKLLQNYYIMLNSSHRVTVSQGFRKIRLEI